MRKKFFQYFANSLTQRFLDIPEGEDLVTLAKLQSGTVVIDFLNGTCTHNGSAMTPLKTCLNYQEWLWRELDRNHLLRTSVYHARLTVRFWAKPMTPAETNGLPPHLVVIDVECQTDLRTTEQSYLARGKAKKTWSLQPGHCKLAESTGAMPLPKRESLTAASSAAL